MSSHLPLLSAPFFFLTAGAEQLLQNLKHSLIYRMCFCLASNSLLSYLGLHGVVVKQLRRNSGYIRVGRKREIQ